MLDSKIPKARLLTIREVIGVDSPEEFGFGPITTVDDTKYLEQLSDEQEDKLSVFKKRGILCETTLSPCYRNQDFIKTKKQKLIIYPSGYRMKNDYQDLDTVCHLYLGAKGNLTFDTGIHTSNIRVVFTWSEISKYCSNCHIAEDGVLEAEYGLWPIVGKYPWLIGEVLEHLYNYQLKMQSAASSFSKDSFEKRLQLLNVTSLKYTTEHKSYEEGAECTINPVYELNGMYFVRIEDDTNGIGGSYKWVPLQPLKLWVDEEKDVAVTAYTVYRVPNYDDTEAYLENFFSKEVFEGMMLLKQKEKIESVTQQEEKPMFPGIEIVTQPKAELPRTYQNSSASQYIQQEEKLRYPGLKEDARVEEKPMFPGIPLQNTDKTLSENIFQMGLAKDEEKRRLKAENYQQARVVKVKVKIKEEPKDFKTN